MPGNLSWACAVAADPGHSQALCAARGVVLVERLVRTLSPAPNEGDEPEPARSRAGLGRAEQPLQEPGLARPGGQQPGRARAVVAANGRFTIAAATAIGQAGG
jgi:hypothetical protein